MRVNYDVYSETEQLSVYNRHALHLTGCMLPWERISNSADIHISHTGTCAPYLAYPSLEVFVQQESITSVFLQIVLLFTNLLGLLLKMLFSLPSGRVQHAVTVYSK